MEDQFRKMLEYFYKNTSQSPNKDIYMSVLTDYLDAAEVQPVHVIAIKEQLADSPLIQNPHITPTTKRRQYIYKNVNFASVFLFGFLLQVLKKEDIAFLQQLHGNIIKMLIEQQNSFSPPEFEYRMLLIDKIFEFLYKTKEKNYSHDLIEHLFKKFYVSVFERRGLRRKQKQKYSEAQILLPYLLAYGNKRFTEEQICNVNSEAYQSNQLNFSISLQNRANNEEWIIGDGSNQIKIMKQRNEYLIEKPIKEEEKEDEPLTKEWEQILEDSKDLRKQYSRNGLVLTGELNFSFDKSPASRRGPKSANFMPVQLKKHRNLFLQ